VIVSGHVSHVSGQTPAALDDDSAAALDDDHCMGG
jgi:hypothetical protein